MNERLVSSIEQAFRDAVPSAVSQGGIGGLFSRSVAPPDIERAPSDEESRMSNEALRQGGWLDGTTDDDALPCLPWLAVTSLAEGEAWLTIDGFHTAPRLLLQPASGAMFARASWNAAARLEPGDWLSLALYVRSEARDEEPSRSREVRLGVRRVANEVVVMVLPEREGLTETWARLLAIEPADWSRALEDRITGTLPQF